MKRTSYMRHYIIFVVLLLVLCLPVAAAQERVSMVILPFKNITQNPSDDWLQESFSENLTMGLGHLNGLHLVERIEIKRILTEQNFGQSALVEAESAPRLGQMVGAKYVMLGNYQKLGTQILINVKLVNTETGTIEPNSLTQIKGDYANLFNLQEQLAQSLIQKLHLEFSQQNQSELKQGLSGTASTEAHEYYIKARIFREKLGDKNIEKAIGLLTLALDEDPQYARAAAEVAGVYLDRANGKEVYPSATPQDLALAESFARQAIALAPTSASGYSILSKVLEAQNNKAAALNMAQKALSLEKTTESILAFIGLKYPRTLYFEAGQAQLIERELKSLGANMEDPQILFTLGGLYFGEIHSDPSADIDKALNFYEQAHQKNPHNPFFTFTLTAVHLLQGDVQKAKNILLPVIEENPENIALLISGAEAARRLLPDLGEIDAEKRHLQRYPDYTLAYFHLATLYLQQEKTNPDNIILLLTGAQALQKLMPEEAISWTQQATERYPHSSEAYFQLAQLYLQQNKDPQAADRWFQKGVPYIGDSPNAAYSAARYLIERKDFAQAKVYLDQALNLWKRAAERGDASLWVQYYLSLNTLAKIHVQQNNVSGALKVYKEITQSILPPLQKGLAYQRMAEIYALQNEYQKAFDAYQEYLQRFPKRLLSAQAQNIYHGYFAQKSLKQEPDNPDFLNDSGQAYLIQGDYVQALKYLSKAQKLAPENAVINYNLGLVYLAQKEPEQAITAFKKAIALNGTYTKAYYNLGVTYSQIGQIETARSYWQKCLALDPEFVAAREALQALSD